MLGFKAENERAVKYQQWLAIEVLPSIRKHGAYMTNEVIERTLTDPDYLIQLATALKEERQARKLAEEKNDKNIQIVSKYNGNKNKVKCKCTQCGYEWSSIASNLMYGGGCPNCSGSQGEMRIRNYLDDNNLNYEREFSFDDLCGDCNKQLRFDFAIFNEDGTIKCLIEYDGIQHFKPINFWGNEYSHTQIRFETLQRYDNRKNNYCKNNGITLIRIPYTEFDNIENILESRLFCQSA